MRLEATAIAGLYRVCLQPVSDERGSFTRLWSRAEFAAAGLDAEPSQCSVSHNVRAGTLRGMHYQAAPHVETKLVSCVRGAVYDVALDLRPASATHRQWLAFELRAAGPLALFIPPGVAHGFMTLEDDSAIHYQIAGDYVAAAARGVRFDDPAFAIRWPREPGVISARDRAFASYCG